MCQGEALDAHAMSKQGLPIREIQRRIDAKWGADFRPARRTAAYTAYLRLRGN